MQSKWQTFKAIEPSGGHEVQSEWQTVSFLRFGGNGVHWASAPAGSNPLVRVRS
jgi:hypothetical protein